MSRAWLGLAMAGTVVWYGQTSPGWTCEILAQAAAELLLILVVLSALNRPEMLSSRKAK